MGDKAATRLTNSFGQEPMVVRRTYCPPKVEEYGRLRDLTGGGPGKTPDGFGRSRTTFFAPESEDEQE